MIDYKYLATKFLGGRPVTIPVGGQIIGGAGQGTGKPLITIVTAGSTLQGIFYILLKKHSFVV